MISYVGYFLIDDHQKIVAVDIASGALSSFDLTADSIREDDTSELDIKRGSKAEAQARAAKSAKKK